MKHNFALVFIMLLVSLAFAQTNPTPQALPYLQGFSNLLWNSSDYPVGTQGWRIASYMSDQFNLSAPVADRIMNSKSYASTTQGNLQNYDGKIGFLSYGLADLSFVFAIDTRNKEDIQLEYDIMTIRNPYLAPNYTLINEVTMLYRIGTASEFTQLTGLEYINNSTNQTGDVTTPQKLEHRAIILPAECEDKPVVQLRLASRHYSGVGSRYPSFAIDNISVTGEDIPTLPVELSSFIATISANNHISLTWVTQTETAMQGYYVLRASDDQLSTARIVSPMIAATNHSQQQSYVFLDTEVYDSGTYYYWLQANDLDGTTNFHGPVSLIYNPLVDNPAPEIPRFTELRAVFPNPFNPRACIDFYLETPAPVVFRVFDAHGRLVRELEPGFCPAGQQRVEWDSRDAAGTLCGSGIYHIRMDVGARSFTGRPCC